MYVMNPTTPMLRSLSYNFPPPHQLGSSSSLRLSRSTQSALVLATPPSGTENTLTQPSPSLGLKYSGSQVLQLDGEEEATDEPDVGRQLGRKAPSSARTKGAPRTKLAKVEAIVKRHNGEPLSEFALFLPPKVPQAILQSRSSLLEFVKSTSMTYLNLWELASELSVLDLRLPMPYSDKLSEDYQFLTEMFSAIVEKLGHVKSIRELYLPQIVLHAHTKVEEILKPFSKTSLTISHMFLPIKTSLQEDDIASFDHKNIAVFLQKSKIQELTLVSVATVVQDFQNELQAEIKKSRRMGTIKVNYSNQEMGQPGPSYIADLGVKPAVGETVDPHKLVSSLNVVPKTGGLESTEKGRHCTRQRKAKGAFSTDCTYSDKTELDTDGPFTSEVWNLDQLHEDSINGSGVTLAIIDSGINYTHAAFKDKIIAVKNFVPEEIDDVDCAIDSDGHGTLCAGIAAGSSFYCPLNSTDPNSPCIRIPSGVAPGVKLIICKVVNTSSGEVDRDAFLSALKWIKQLHSNSVRRIDVVSISLASTYHSHERARVISDLTNMGVIIVCCASNVGRLRFQPISFPARLGHVLCIGAQDMNGKPTSFSPVGRELDFLAPGDDIWGPGPGTVGPFAMDCASGTSCATPGVAGLVCLVLHAITLMCEKDQEKYQIAGKPLIDFVRNVWVMREILKEMSSSPGHHSDEIGYGTLNPYRVLDRSPEEILRLINEIIEDE